VQYCLLQQQIAAKILLPEQQQCTLQAIGAIQSTTIFMPNAQQYYSWRYWTEDYTKIFSTAIETRAVRPRVKQYLMPMLL
jgi:hypothetical protein